MGGPAAGDDLAAGTRTIAGVPLLLVAPAAARRPLPLVLWFPGLGADKEANRAELERVARAGFLAVGVDAAGHGARRLPDLDARISVPLAEARRVMLALAETTASELPAVVDGLVAEGLADRDRVSLVGISMGGYLVYRALGLGLPLRAAVAVLGSPEWGGDASPHRHPAAAHATALLSITAEHDASVPPAEARRFHEALRASHPHPERERYVDLPGARHLMSGEDWERTMTLAVEWLVRFGA